MPAIPLYRGRGKGRVIVAHTIVDAADYDALNQWQWGLHDGYAVRFEDKGKKMIRMHRALLGLEQGDPREGDHIDRDRLNNRRANLRAISSAGNRQNKTAHRTSRFGRRTSQHRGVCWDKRTGKWFAYATVHRKRHSLGLHEHEDDAARIAAEFRAQQMPYATS